MNRMVLGALAGAAATLPMTAVMRRLHAKLPPEQRQALPPRPITVRATRPRDDASAQTMTMLAHFTFGAATGALFASVTRNRNPAAGAGYGLFVWAASYLGWVPLAGLLPPADRQPAGRNGVMIFAHLVWGAVLAAGLLELEQSDRAFGTDRQPGKS